MAAASTDKVAILGGARTPIGSYGGALAQVPAHELGAAAARGALERTGVEGAEIGEAVFGCIGQVGGDAYIARRIALAAGLPTSTPGYTVNRLCGSGLQAIWNAGMELRWGTADYILAGGAENMSRMPFYDFGARAGARLGNRTLTDGTLAMLTDPFHDKLMGWTAERVADKYSVSRAEQDEFAAESQRRTALSESQDLFAAEIVAVTTPGRKSVTVSTDEHPRPGTTTDVLAGLRPSFGAEGSVTAGNSSGINDGACAVVVALEEVARDQGHAPLATLEAVGVGALEPEFMGYAPVLALQDLFAQTGLAASDIDLFEVNEAFAAQAVAVVRDAGLDPERTNPHGGAIALGHPVGATGAMLTLRAALDLNRRDLEYAVVTMCIGGGQALAALIRRAG
ncbi:MAG: hypothetical protein RLZ55_818 [Actinomycetota bacterium]|jgi:acetyl-CoA C-acetyltransferase